MSGKRVGAAAGIAVLVATVASAAAPVRSASARLAVGYSNEHALAHALRKTHATLVRKLAPLHIAEVRAHDVQRLRRAPGIRFVERLAPRVSVSEPALALSTTTGTGFEWQYGATRADAVPDAVLRAAASIAIAVIDTGADLTAPDIAAKSPRTYNTRAGTADVRDTNGHGTFVASIAAGSVTNGDGIAGSGGDAQLLVIKSGSASGAFSDMDEAAGIMYAVDHGAKIVNLSVGGPSSSATERRAIQYAVQHGVLLVAAAGNEYAHGNPTEYPAALLQPPGSNGVGGSGLAVAASTFGGTRAPFSNTGSWLSLAAPGENVFGAVSPLSSPALYPRTELPGAKDGLYGYGSGTSFASPQVAGAAALVWAANPSLHAQQVAQILKETASGHGGWTPDLGFGVIDVAAAVDRAQAGTPGVLLSGRRVARKLTLNWGGDAASYSLSVSTDFKAPRTVLASTTRTSTSFRLSRGHSYVFTVSALDATGVTTAISAPLAAVGL